MPTKICSVEGCETSIRHGGRRMCPKHYQRWKRNSKDRPRCRVAECNCPIYCEKMGLCSRHYQCYRKHGALEADTEHSGITRKNYSLYLVFKNMKQRCSNPKNGAYASYGARGITVCDRWLEKPHGFRNFLEDMGPRPDGTSLDRIDVDGPYSPDNCRWATKEVQATNKRNLRKYSDKVGVSFDTSVGLWRATLAVNGIVHKKSAKTEEEAIKLREQLEKEYS